MRIKKGILYIMVFGLCACGNSQPSYTSPKGYDLTSPVIYQMADNLVEISGIALYQGDPDVIYAEQDEKGKLYWLRPADGKASNITFGKDGDFEDLAITDRQVIMLRSDGTLFTFPFAQGGKFDTNTLEDQVKKWKGLVGPGEYEGLYADAASHKLYVLCKGSQLDRNSPKVSGYIFSLTEWAATQGNIDSGLQGLQPVGTFSIDVRQIEAKRPGKLPEASGKKKNKQSSDKVAGLHFKPSALSWNPRSKQWFVLSSVNKMLVVTDASWQVQEVHLLDPSLFGQPEGMTFDRNNDLYISNEGSASKKGTILKFVFRP